MEIKARFVAAGRVGYNKNYEVGGWVSFPITPEELVKKFKTWVEGEEMPEYAKYMFKIIEWEAPSFIKDYLGLPIRAFNLDSVNEVAEHLEDINDRDIPIIAALLEADYDIEDACKIAANEEYEDLRNKDDVDIAREYVEDNYNVPDYVLDNVDWANVVDDFFDREEGYVYVGTGDKQGYIRVDD